ncbi:hypothetical protein [Bifidobacterium longum]|uniref:hypothetical protein n=1 Tax=Bifidobacterium longum TaxID=216816 RepID=UPI00256FF2C4|nr:hypothetical protein [Bifidobacterium longum]MDL5541549.1 hypothetical protein [Bifidobacterium longum]
MPMSSAVLGSYALAMPIASAAHALDAVSPRTPRLLIRVPFRIWSVYVPIRYTSNVWPARLAPSAPCSVMVVPAVVLAAAASVAGAASAAAGSATAGPAARATPNAIATNRFRPSVPAPMRMMFLISCPSPMGAAA